MKQDCGCIKELCEHYNFGILYPDLKKEWDYEKNVELPENISPSSGKKIFWICLKDPCGCHKWEAKISHRKSGTGCPFCSHKKICSHNNFKFLYPELAEEWDYEKNGNLRPEHFAPSATKIVFWTCRSSQCSCHKWEAKISCRKYGSGCPFCLNKRLCSHNNLVAKFPEIIKEWDFEKNGDLNPEKFPPFSDQKVWWKCLSINICNCHSYKARIRNKTRGNKGCPFCMQKKTCPHNNLTITHPKISCEWHPNKNSKPVECFTFGSDYKAWWTCPNDDLHVYQAIIQVRTTGGSACPFCKKSNGEQIIMKVLNELKIEYVCEYIDPDLPRKRYDFMFTYKNKRWISEYDGVQHFIFNNFFNKREGLQVTQELDILKTKFALEKGYNVIRISYKVKSFENIMEHITQALSLEQTTYYSHPEMYNWLNKRLT